MCNDRTLGNRRQLRHPRAADDAGGADRPSADPDFDHIGPGFDQRPYPIRRHHIAGEDNQGGKLAANRTNCLNHPAAVTVRSVQCHRIDPSFMQGPGAL